MHFGRASRRMQSLGGRLPLREGFLLFILVLVTLNSDVSALLADRILASADLSAIRSESGDLLNETLRQQYNARWSRQLLPYVTLSSSFRYFRFELADEEIASIWQKEMMPRAELAWRHPQFHFNAGVSRRDSWFLSGQGVLRSEALNFALRTRDSRYPILSLFYDWQHSVESGQGILRNTKDKRLRGEFNYSRGGGSIGYSLTRRLSENLLPGLESEQLDHQLRWSSAQQGLVGGRVQLSTQYSFNRSTREDRVKGAEGIFEKLTITVPLYSEDHAPEFGTLEESPGLSDGDKSSPIDPPIDIGGSGQYRNLGADLGFERPISAVFVYTDRSSGSGVSWDVYASNDNLDWERRTSSAVSTFNVVLNRYEIEFDSFDARYVKVVNIGLNEVAEVLITEIEIYQSVLTEDRSVMRDSQLGQVRLGIRMSDRMSAAIDMSFQYEPATGLVESRMNSGYKLTSRFEQVEWLSHHFRWEQALQDFDKSEGDILDNVASYSMLIDPVETLGASFTFIQRQSWFHRDLDQEISSASLDFHGEPGWGLDFSMNLLRNQTVQYRDKREFKTWSYRTSMGGALTSNLDFRFSYSIRDTRSVSGDLSSQRQLWGIEYNYRMTRTLQTSGRFNVVTDVEDFRNQGYNLTWRPLPPLSLSGMLDLTDGGGGLDTRRYSLGVNYDMNRRSAFYLSLAVTDLSNAGGSRTTSFQQGFRTRF